MAGEALEMTWARIYSLFRTVGGAFVAAAALAACQSPPINRNPAGESLDSTLSHLKSFLLSERKSGAYWSAPFTGDVTSDALMMALGKKIGLLTPDQSATYAQTLSERLVEDRTGWAAYPGSAPDFNVTAIAVLCLKFAGFAEDSRFQAAFAWFESQGGGKRVNERSEQLYARLMLGPLDLVPEQYDPMLTPSVFGMPKEFPLHLDKTGFMRGLVVPSVAIRYLEHLPDHSLSADFDSTEDWLKQLPEIGKYHVKNPGVAGSRRCRIPENDVDNLLNNIQRDPEHYRRCIFYPEGKGENFKSRMLRFFHEPITDRFTDYLMDALNFVIRRSVTGTKVFWAEQALILELQLLNPGGAWYTTGFTMCGLRLLQEAQRTGLGNFQAEIAQAWNAVQRARTTNQDGQLIQPWVLTGTWDTASVLLAFSPLKDTPWALSPEDTAASTQWLLNHSIVANGTRAWSFDETDKTLPDVDDTALVMATLSDALPSGPEKRQVIDESVAWLNSRKNSDGGYPAWATSMSRLLTLLPGAKQLLTTLADFSQPDVTGRVVFAFDQASRALASLDDAKTTAILNEHQAQACAFLSKEMPRMKDRPLELAQGNWMVNYVYSASSILTGLATIGCDPPRQAELAAFILSAQQLPSGGWGEDPSGYATESYVSGPPTLMQSSVAISGLLAYYQGLPNKTTAPARLLPALSQGAQFLIDKIAGIPRPSDSAFDGVLVRGTTYGRYELGPAYLSLYALGRWKSLGLADK